MSRVGMGRLVLMLLLLTLGLKAETIAIYGHISLAEAGAKVLRAGENTAEEATVNLPLLGGDSILTAADGRCEIQSDNGTIVRLDHDSQLSLVTVLAPSLTSSWKMTTLKLVRGSLYIINNTYNHEMVQVQTPNAAVKLPRDCCVLLSVTSGEETSVRMLAGRAWLMYGRVPDGLEEQHLGRGQALRVSKEGQVASQEKVFSDFQLWNEGIDRHFDELHEGRNLLPKPLQRYSPALVYWAEKWSSRYGEWMWDDRLGYVWRPFDETFTWRRPFFNARWVTIHDRLFLVPQESWGWAPAYLGTWHWMGKQGWVWIPGNFGDSEPWYMNLGWRSHYGFYTLSDWFGWYYGPRADWDFWTWSDYRARESRFPRRPSLPPEIKRTLHALGNVAKEDRERLMADEARQLREQFRDRPVGSHPTERAEPTLKEGARLDSQRISRLDWNPDVSWARRNGQEVEYRPGSNEFVCAKLHLASRSLSVRDRMQLRMSDDRIPGMPTPSRSAMEAATVNPQSMGEGAAVGRGRGDGDRVKKDDGKGRN